LRCTCFAVAALLALGLATVPGHAAEVVSVEGSGGCHYDGAGGSDETRIAADTGPGTDAGAPAPSSVEGAATACGTAAASGELPDAGALQVSVAAADGAAAVGVDTVPLTAVATGQDEVLAVGAQAEGACKDNAAPGPPGGEEEVGAYAATDGTYGAEGPDVDEVRTALVYCVVIGPGPGSHLAASGSAADGAAVAGASTVPVTDHLP
jgi:hypothetical protein